MCDVKIWGDRLAGELNVMRMDGLVIRGVSQGDSGSVCSDSGLRQRHRLLWDFTCHVIGEICGVALGGGTVGKAFVCKMFSHKWQGPSV